MESQFGAASTAYAYDTASQLTSTTPSSGPATTYTYDQAGRRARATQSGTTTNYTYDPYGRLESTATPTSTEACTYGPDDQLVTTTTTSNVATLTWVMSPASGQWQPVTLRVLL